MFSIIATGNMITIHSDYLGDRDPLRLSVKGPENADLSDLVAAFEAIHEAGRLQGRAEIRIGDVPSFFDFVSRL